MNGEARSRPLQSGQTAHIVTDFEASGINETDYDWEHKALAVFREFRVQVHNVIACLACLSYSYEPPL